ncbi:MarR family winged helix-turn-helix transcriptional regulator [Desulfosediminicola ganghwensis]|uniref:MarR family winged helix-turn-helix transcriptional regulator n=1 Tax=Desulfosediminicola ganghwensis TaxID=2569540 RepID=UPI0010ABC597|nr:MarR family transcriptional regulator [Desulfosediminicola ganghwensis]
MEHQLFFKLNLSQRVLIKWVDREMTDLVGATTTQIAAILYLMENDGCQPVDLSRELLQNKSAITTLAERMEKKGLIYRAPSAKDGRASILHLTEKGREIGIKAIPYISEYNRELMKGFSEVEVAVIDRFFESIMRRFETVPDNYFKRLSEE